MIPNRSNTEEKKKDISNKDVDTKEKETVIENETIINNDPA